MKRALITGITGQDGSYLAELLLEKGYEVHGLIRRASQFNTQRIDHLFDQLNLHYGDMTDGTSLRHILNESKADEVYNLAAQSHVKVSFECPEYTMETIAMGTLRLLEAIRDINNSIRMYQASTSEMYGNVTDLNIFNEQTPFNPVSPYGVAKLNAHRMCQIYRQAYDVKVSCGILFNHESPRRGETFISRKVCKAVARIEKGLQKKLEVGNLQGMRDWGWAPEYVECMWRMLQVEPDDFVLATGEVRTVRDLCETAFTMAGMLYEDYTSESSRLKRSYELHYLKGDANKAKKVLGWKPTVGFNDMIKMILEAERKVLSMEKYK